MVHQDMAANAVVRDQMFDTSSQGLVDAPTAPTARLSKVCEDDYIGRTKTFPEPSRAVDDVSVARSSEVNCVSLSTFHMND